MAEKSQSVQVKGAGRPVSSEASHPFLSLRSQIDRLFEDFSEMFDRGPFSRKFLDMPRVPGFSSEIAAVVPAVDVVEDDKTYRVTAELPGISQKDIDVSMEGDVLTIRGEKKEEREEKEKGFYLSERRFGSFQRSLRVPDGIDEGKIEAKFDNGVLTVVLPKSPESIHKAKKIEVKAK